MPPFEQFRRHFCSTDRRPCGELSLIARSAPESVLAVVSELGGQTFNTGLYRVCQAREVREATRAAKLAFPELAERISVFGYDWLGRCFAADAGRLSRGVPQVLMLEVGAGEAMQIPSDVIAFHDRELVHFPDDALAKRLFEQWQAIVPVKLQYDQCAGYKVPLFLGGSDTVDNLEVCDLSVYWHICGQLRTGLATLNEGQTIADVRIS